MLCIQWGGMHLVCLLKTHRNKIIYILKNGQRKTNDLCSYFNSAHEVDIRADISNYNIKKLLKEKHIKWKFSPFSKDFIRIQSGLGDLLTSNMFSKGNFFVQDRAAGAAIELLDPRPGDVVLDVCAAPGTKSIYIYHWSRLVC